MKCFEVVKAVLDVAYAQIPGDEPTKDAAVKTALQAMSAQYRQLLTSGGPDFADPVTRFAYVYLYVPAHAHWIHELLEWSPDARLLFEQKRLRMTCLGGGPGSDLVGALKFMATRGLTPAVFCEIVDGCIQWKQTWSDLSYTLEWFSALHTDYVIHDLADARSWSAPCNFSKADLFTINFFASEVRHIGQRAEEYFGWCFSQAKPGALILMNDNNDSRFYEWFDAIAAGCSLEPLLSSSGTRKIYDSGEQLSALGEYHERFDRNSKLTGDLAWRVFRKR